MEHKEQSDEYETGDGGCRYIAISSVCVWGHVRSCDGVSWLYLYVERRAMKSTGSGFRCGGISALDHGFDIFRLPDISTGVGRSDGQGSVAILDTPPRSLQLYDSEWV
jgi:hypothetical protein